MTDTNARAAAEDAALAMREWGLPNAQELQRIVVVSPHLDDAVLGCGNFLAANPGTTVVTVFAGNPPAYPNPMRKWDVQGGFAPGDDVMATRRAEDDAALAHLAATPVHLDQVEYSYNPDDKPTPPAQIVDVLAPALEQLAPTLVLAPFGLANPDHDVTHRACMLARDRLPDDISWWCYEESKRSKSDKPGPSWWLYEDFGYKHIPGMLAWRVSSLFRAGIWPTPVCPRIDSNDPRKRTAIDCYATQLPALEEDWQISAKLQAPAPEQFWRIEPLPPGWERLTNA